jgi:hypothetical protein
VLVTLALGAVAGLAAAVVMDVPMSRQSEGFTPAYLAASVLRRTPPSDVSFRDANVVHHAAGALAGVLYAVVAGALALALGATPSPAAVASALPAHAVGVVAVVVFVYLLFAHLVLPRAGGTIYEERATAVRGQWLRSSLVFGAALAVIAPALFSVVG